LSRSRYSSFEEGAARPRRGIYLRRLLRKADHGFTPQAAKEPRTRLKPFVRKTQPDTKKIAHRSIWVEPVLSNSGRRVAMSAPASLRGAREHEPEIHSAIEKIDAGPP